MKILITNKKAGGRGVYVGRPSLLGNPFPLQREEERLEVIGKFEGWLKEQLVSNPAVRGEMNRLYKRLLSEGVLELTCWCSPRKCHAEVIATELARAARARGLAVEVEYR